MTRKKTETVNKIRLGKGMKKKTRKAIGKNEQPDSKLQTKIA